ncbi:hypothetical protein Q5H93_10365 [Hymenobacter sp. ASUV-10]|uniref:PH domain-containing protein n=1 Tax=Hymenobacter aranciens TaxID=3063996 RepID=A0ABT9BA47_9BACT|nr:hypothetical protein [Hymenobacter sp. ASUV-10]MDO7875135.1 hypothetical protein [Hymenobacter sp. ASUV-10]
MKNALLRPLLEVALLLLVALGITRWLTGLFGVRVKLLRLSAGRQLRLAFWPLLALDASLSAVSAMLLNGRSAQGFEWVLAAVFFGLTLTLSLPAFVLHVRYWLLNNGTEVIFQPEANQFEIYEQGQRQFFNYRDILKVERVSCRARRTFWVNYDYLRLHLADGRILTLTSLLGDLEPLTTFLRSAPTERRAVAWCWV